MCQEPGSTIRTRGSWVSKTEGMVPVPRTGEVLEYFGRNQENVMNKGHVYCKISLLVIFCMNRNEDLHYGM